MDKTRLPAHQAGDQINQSKSLQLWMDSQAFSKSAAAAVHHCLKKLLGILIPPRRDLKTIVTTTKKP